MKSAFITGASRGIGLALAAEYIQRGWRVIAACRAPERADALRQLEESNPNCIIEKLDVTNCESIQASAKRYSDVSLDLLINNAGLFRHHGGFEHTDVSEFQDILRTNVIGPILVLESFLSSLRSAPAPKAVSISSALGSIECTTGGSYAYRVSKAGLNMAMRSIAFDLRHEGIIVCSLSPGLVDTALTRDVRGLKISPAESARGLADVIESLTIAESGTFRRYSGETLPW